MITVSVSVEPDSITRKLHLGSHTNYDFVYISEARFVRLCVAELLSGTRLQI